MSWLQRASRRRFVQAGVLGYVSALGCRTPVGQARTRSASLTTIGARGSFCLGTTFSPLQCYYMNLDFRQTFRQICHLGLHRVRLGAYWNVIEKQRGEYDFTELDWLLEQCAQHNIDVVLVVGMKVPRWPEFHFPQWVSDCEDTGPGYAPLDRRSPKVAKMALQFVEQVVHHCRTAPALKYWQIENG